jgi:hypothetical protein
VPRAWISVTELIRKVGRDGIDVRDAELRPVRTNATGAYRLSVTLRQTAGFVAATESRLSRCPDRGSTPGGCRSETFAGTQSTPITISLQRPHA